MSIQKCKDVTVNRGNILFIIFYITPEPSVSLSGTDALKTEQEGTISCYDARDNNNLKYFYPESEGFNITIRSSVREESRWVSCLLSGVMVRETN